MTRSIGDHLPATVVSLLDGSDLAGRAGHTFLLITNDAHDWPHVAMLSVGELLADSAQTLRAALWPNSTTSSNLSRTGRALLALVVEGRAYYLRVTTRRESDLELGTHGQLAQFRFSVEEILEDAAEYAELTSGITFRLRSPSDVVPRWDRTIAALRSA